MGNTLSFRVRGSVHAISQDEILYLENDRRKIRLHLVDDEMSFYGTFRQVRSQLDEQFLWTGRSCIVNMDWVRSLKHTNHYEILLYTGREIHVSRAAFRRTKIGLAMYLMKQKK